MESSKASQKSLDILKAIAKGCSCEQILAGDRTLTYHDIFHSVSEVPTSHWKKNSAKSAGKGWPREANAVGKPARQRID
jgi:hypothetical protein